MRQALPLLSALNRPHPQANPVKAAPRLADRLALALKIARGADLSLGSSHDPRLTQLVRAIADHNTPLWPRLDVYSQQADEYSRSTWVYVAVTRIAEAAALVPFGVQRWIDGQWIATPNHPIEQLLRAPNPTMSQFELLEATFGYLELNGNAYWYLAGDDQGQPAEIWPLRPDRVRVVPDRTRYVGAYVYLIDGLEIPLQAEEVIHFKRWHPKDDYLGLSALEAAAMASQTDQAMAAWNHNFFEQGKAVPAGIVTIKNMISDADFDRIKREWVESYGGKQRKTAFIRGSGEVGWANIGLSQQESDFINARQMSKAEILQVFGIPAGLYDKDATYANASAARETFRNDTLWPKLIRFSQKLTQHLAPFYADYATVGERVESAGRLVVQPEDIRDNATELAEIEAARGFLSINEIRARYFNLPAVAWGDSPAGMSAVPGMPPPSESGLSENDQVPANPDRR